MAWMCSEEVPTRPVDTSTPILARWTRIIREAEIRAD